MENLMEVRYLIGIIKLYNQKKERVPNELIIQLVARMKQAVEDFEDVPTWLSHA